VISTKWGRAILPGGGMRPWSIALMMNHRKKSKEIFMLTTIIVILLILWLLGFFGPGIYSGIPSTGNAVHTLLVIALILIVLRALGVL
jgi:hypothetical protein